jgi:hypothetical protein
MRVISEANWEIVPSSTLSFMRRMKKAFFYALADARASTNEDKGGGLPRLLKLHEPIERPSGSVISRLHPNRFRALKGPKCVLVEWIHWRPAYES